MFQVVVKYPTNKAKIIYVKDTMIQAVLLAQRLFANEQRKPSLISIKQLGTHRH